MLFRSMLGPHPSVVERGSNHVVVAVIDRIDDVDRALVRTQQHFAPFLAAVGLEVGIERVDRNLGRIARRPLNAAGQAQTLAIMRDFAIARNARVKRQRGLIARGAGHIGAAAVRGGEAVGAVDRIEARLRPANGVVADLLGRGLLIGGGDRCAERAVGRLPPDQAGDARAPGVGQIVIAALRRCGEGETFLALERVAGVEVDDRTERTFVEVGGDRKSTTAELQSRA